MSGGGGTFSVHAACIRGVEAFLVTVEISSSGSIPGLTIVGMPDASVMEARSRIRCALRSSGFDVPRRSLTISLSPGDIRKTGTGFDLPIAVAILALSDQIPKMGLDGCLFVGELALDGTICVAKGEVAHQLLARERKLRYVGGFCPGHVPVAGADARYLERLDMLKFGVEDATRRFPTIRIGSPSAQLPDFGDVVGQEIAKRGMAVAAVGGFGVLMVGPPGAGKTMIAKRMPGILPPLDDRELQEALCIHSVAGEPTDALLRGERPYRSPHHSISIAGLLGGGRPVRPGEISLAHGGVLHLDELGEFSGNVLQSLRQPMEEGEVRIVRVDGAYVFPAHFQLVAASNPCPCGHLGDRDVPCRCSESAIARYRAKLGGPMADRIDIVINVARPDPDLIIGGTHGKTTSELRSEVEAGRAFAKRRRCRGPVGRGGPSSASLDSIVRSYGFDERGAETLLDVARSGNLSARGIIRLCRISRSIADMAESDRIEMPHVLEGSQLQGRRDDGRV